MSENIYGPGGLPALLLKYLKQIPDSDETIDIGAPARRYKDTYTKRLLSEEAAIAELTATQIDSVQNIEFADGAVAIGDATTEAAGPHAVAIGAGTQNTDPHTVKLGCEHASSVFPGNIFCDLGTNALRFKRAKLSQGVEGFFVGNAGTTGGPTRLALGDDAVNTLDNSILLGNPLCGTVYPNNHQVCDLGTAPASFRNIWMWGNLSGTERIIPNGIAIMHGQNAEAEGGGVAIGTNAFSASAGVAVGGEAKSTDGGTSVGWSASAGTAGTAFGKETVAAPSATVIGYNCQSLAAGAHVFGVGTQNSEAHTLLIGDFPDGLVNIRPGVDLATDLGTATNKFKTIFVNHVQHPVARFVMDSPIELKSGDNQDLLITPTPDSSSLIPATTTSIGDCFRLTLKGNLDTVTSPSTGTIILGTQEQGALIEHKFEVNSIYTEAQFVCDIDCTFSTSGMNTHATFVVWYNNDYKSITRSASFNQTGWDAGIDHTVTLAYSSSDINVFRPKEIFFRRI